MEKYNKQRFQKLAGLICENQSDETIEKGILKKEEDESNGNEYYYVNLSVGIVLLSKKLMDKLGDEKLDNLLDKENKWKFIVWDYLESNPTKKYKIIDLI